jgi:hypothetical protein
MAVSSSSVGVIRSRATILLSKYGKEISENDVKKCRDASSVAKIPLDKESLHQVMCGFSVDGEAEIRDPLNLEGVKLEGRMNIVTVSSSVLNNLSRAVTTAGLIPEAFVFSAIASAKRILENDDLAATVLVLNLRKDLTECAVFSMGILESCEVFTCGEDQIFDQAGVINAGILEYLCAKIIALEAWHNISKVTLISEGLPDERITGSLEKLLALPVMIGYCRVYPFEELPEDAMAYAVGMGILDHARAEHQRKRLDGNFAKKFFHKSVNFIDRYF